MTSPEAVGSEEGVPGGLVSASLGGTVLFAVVAAAAVAAPGALAAPAAVVDLVLFAAGIVAFVWTLVRAADRSREELLSVAGIWFLAGSAPASVRRKMLGALAAQVLIALASASARPFTPLAFGVLVPMFGLGLAGAHGVAAGRFPPRGPASGRH